MNDVILVCFRVRDLGDDHHPDSFVDKCIACREDVFVAPQTMKDIAQHHPGDTALILCSLCAPAIAVGMGAEWADTPQQQEAWQFIRGELGDPTTRMIRAVLGK